MSNKPLATTIFIIVGVILQLALAPNVAIFGVAPNFLLIATVIVALINGSFTGATAGFILGLLFDFIGTGPIGPMALVGTLIGYLAGTLQKNMRASSWVMPLTVFGICFFLAGFAYSLTLEIVSSDFMFWKTVLYKVIPATLYDTALALAVFPFINKLLQPDPKYMTVRRRF